MALALVSPRRLERARTDESGQSTAEYALVIVAAAALAGLLISFLGKSDIVSAASSARSSASSWDTSSDGGAPANVARRGCGRRTRGGRGQATVEFALRAPRRRDRRAARVPSDGARQPVPARRQRGAGGGSGRDRRSERRRRAGRGRAARCPARPSRSNAAVAWGRRCARIVRYPRADRPAVRRSVVARSVVHEHGHDASRTMRTVVARGGGAANVHRSPS